MLWLSLHFPHLPLEVIERGTGLHEPLVVVTGQGGQSRVLRRNRSAAAAGISPGMPLSAAQGLASAVRVRQRNEAVESAALEHLAGWAGQFTATVSVRPPDGLLLEVGRSLRLFRGLENLLHNLQRELSELGYRARRGLAPTPLGAWLLARAGDQRPVFDRTALLRQIGALPLGYLELPPTTLDSLQRLGLRRIRDCLRLPRRDLVRRLGPELLDYLDRLLGEKPDPPTPFRSPATFASRLLLPAEVQNTEPLLFALRRLLLELVGFLRGRDGVVQRLQITLMHRRRPASELTLALATPSRDLQRLQLLLRERLERLELQEPVVDIGLQADEILEHTAASDELFAPIAVHNPAWPQLVERLRARLGHEPVRHLSPVAEHRPERAWHHHAHSLSATPADPRPRPLWLLAQPRALGDTRTPPPWLRLHAGPERIESGWWDGVDVARDYFIAEDQYGARLWIFRELREPQRWFLHGLFA